MMFLSLEMIARPLWMDRLVLAWKQVPIVWLTGPRRTGKTVLAQSVPDAQFFNCDLPSVAERLALFVSVCHAVQHAHLVLILTGL